ncbi:hypothetical protein C3Z10_21950 (plasmid) [Bacillus velezensis]|uniref:Tetratricopeptide repeat protein n=1 Tax=Bacillus velezensis TaxID=492670 RepID=A0ABC8DFM8_BACVE|nr:hypothetical protein C3Z10_21950 [Bacillus velezensis]AWX74614.1 tetratricopeptide repeat protein [Bacillus velezensis]
MLNKKVPSACFANSLNRWYELIKKGDGELSKIKKAELREMLTKSEDSSDLVDYYILLCHRHDALFEEEVTDDLVKFLSRGSHDLLINFYYELFSGDYKFFNKNYFDAIEFYKRAERRLLSMSEDTIGTTKFADFHYKIGVSYYEIDQHVVSVTHVKQAKEIYEKDKNFILEAIQCSLVMGICLYDMGRYPDADSSLRSALTDALAFGYDKPTAKIYHNLGLIRWQEGLYVEAKELFLKAESFSWLKESPKGLQNLYMLSRVSYEMGDAEEGNRWYNLGCEMTERYDSEEFRIKLQILYCLYEEFSVENVLSYCDALREKNLWPDVAKIEKSIAAFFEKKGDISMSYTFLKRALYSREQIPKIREALG